MKFLLIVFAACAAFAQSFPGAAALDAAIEEAIRNHEVPGAVLLVGNKGQIVHRKAYGSRALVPSVEPMTENTIFDCASLTKVVATTSSLMKLFEQGKIRLIDPVTKYIPEFQGGKSGITVRNLLTHFSGLRPDLDLQPPWSGYETGIKLANIDKPTSPPGVRFVYSDINFILLGEIVRRVSGQMVSDYARQNIFLPLGMKESTFQPPASLRPRIAPTEQEPKNGPPLRGVVHDPTARYMGGVAGHAGLFSTAADLSRFAQMMLNRGELDGVRLFSPLTVGKFTSPQSPPDQPLLRGLGWDIDSPFSTTRGELFSLGSYGHTGFTGTSIWMDPATQTYVILLANSVHPFRRPPITPLRGKVATITAAALGVDAPGAVLTGYNETLSGAGSRREVARNGDVMTGLDVLAADNFRPLADKRVGLITNHTGLDRAGRRNIDRMISAGVKLTALFSPEHGISGTEDKEDVANSKDAGTGLPIYSLYAGKTRRPNSEMLRSIEVLVFDIQDIGARFYTYVSTMGDAMEEAAKAGIPFYVLDRPNPITGTHVEGPMLEPALQSFVGYLPLPLRHGMTIGELAQWIKGERKLSTHLTVIRMKNWQRGDWFDSTGLTWVNPSPNMRSLNAALLYPGIAMLEYSKNYTVGRGTDSPFEQIGAAFIDGHKLATYLNNRYIPGVRVYATRFQPESGNLAGTSVEGVRFVLTNRETFDSTRLGLEIAAALQKLYPGKIAFISNAKLIGNNEVIRLLEAGEDPRSIQQKQQDSLEAFAVRRRPYLLYSE